MPLGFCPTCGVVRHCRAVESELYHRHKLTNTLATWFPIYENVKSYPNEQTYRLERGLEYYDLIALPGGGHVPVPIAVRIIGRAAVGGIPLDRQHWRDGRFFNCDLCRLEDTDLFLMTAGENGIVLPEGLGSSFFRCRKHFIGDSAEYSHAKEIQLQELATKKQLKRCRYVRAKTRIQEREARF